MSLLKLVVLALLSAFGPLAIDMYLPAFPQIAADLGADTAAVQMSLSAFLVGVSLAQLAYGPLSDKLGRRAPLLAGVALFALTAGGCAFAGDAAQLVWLRVVMSAGAASGMVLSRAIIRDLAEGRAAASAFSLMMLIMGAAPILAPVLGAQILRVAGWRWIFGAMALSGVVAWLAAWAALPESLPAERRATGGVASAFGDYWRLLRNREYLGYLLVLAAHGGALFSFITCSPVVFQRGFGMTPADFSAVFAVVSLGMVLMTGANYALLRRFAPGRLLKTALVVMAVASATLLGCVLAGVFDSATAAGATAGGAVAGGAANFWLFSALLFVPLALGGMISPNATTLALMPCGRMAGAASALIGTVVFAAGGVAGGIASRFAAHLPLGGAAAMCTSIALCGATGLASFYLAGAGKTHSEEF
ncbi:MAG: multidrug effflux MFS transporter [Puniceicoccales bacterium]|jgi:DHA1 family bicyclomycin/chloramphenicol resistance-like MFS transporter|nr:multidrug effflux MFS transporter [Puniceicoccales bacterium]